MKTLSTLLAVSMIAGSLAAVPAMAQTNTPPADQNTTGSPGGAVTTPGGKTVQTPPTPPEGNKGGEGGGSGK